jgi:hypothetical protein
MMQQILKTLNIIMDLDSLNLGTYYALRDETKNG